VRKVWQVKQKSLSHFQIFKDFWTWLIQVENVEIHFDKLKKPNSNNWTEETETGNLRGKHPLTRGTKKKIKEPA
jgi:hypothetical protein